MQVTIRFNLPDDQAELDTTMSASAYHLTLVELDEWLRGKLKYEQLSNEQDLALQACRDKLRELMDENGAKIF